MTKDEVITLLQQKETTMRKRERNMHSPPTFGNKEKTIETFQIAGLIPTKGIIK